MKCKLYFQNFLFLTMLILSSLSTVIAQPGARVQRAETAAKEIDFLGWEYDKIGYTLNPDEELSLRFRNNTDSIIELPISYVVNTYEGKQISKGNSILKLKPGQTGGVAVNTPAGMEDGAYKILFTLDHKTYQPNTPFHFDFRKPETHPQLNVKLISFIENMDSEGWVRMMMGKLAKYADIQQDWPANPLEADAAIVIAEAMDAFNPKLAQLQEYVRMGGTMICFGQPSHVLYNMLPVTQPGSRFNEKRLEIISKPQQLVLAEEGPWKNFNPENGPLHYALKVVSKQGAKVLANWEDGTPAVVSGSFGKGKVIYVGTGAGQVWQDNPAFEGIDELSLRLLYDAIGGELAVDALLEKAESMFNDKTKADRATRDFVFANLKVNKPENFVIVGDDNFGRFGWINHDGGLTESILENGSVSAVGTQDWKLMAWAPMNFERKLEYRISPANTNSPVIEKVDVNWFSKTLTWKYPSGESVKSTVSLGSPAILWEGNASALDLHLNSVTHLSFPTRSGMKTISKGETINPTEINENWFLAFTAESEFRDLPQLIIMTKKPVAINFKDALVMEFGKSGFGAVFTGRLWGVKRLAPGETMKWVSTIPSGAVSDARRWSQIALNYPVNCDEIGWLNGDDVLLADRFTFREFSTDWKTKALQMTILPPVFFLAQNIGAPVELPKGLVDLNCYTKYGPIKAVKGNTSLVKIPLPQTDHRAIVPVEGRMIVQDLIDYRVAGLAPRSLQYSDGNVRDEGGGLLQADLIPYDISRAVPFHQAPNIDLYKWWLTFNATQVRQVYGDSVRQVMDDFHKTRYLETLNFYSHKSFVMQKREPFTGSQYPISFVWPTQTNMGFRNFNDANEASGHNAYCIANYAKYYGDWTTVRANWNFLRYLHDPLPKIHDWACMSSGALEYWVVSGLDMLNSEAYGSLAYAYAAEYAGSVKDVVLGKVLGARSLIPTVARWGLKDYLTSISADGDEWQSYDGFYHFNEHGFQLSRNKMGGVGMLDTSKGTFHELTLGYKLWSAKHTNQEQIALAGGYNTASSNTGPDLTQRLILGWNIDSLSVGLKNQVQNIDYQRAPRWQESTSLYDLAILCVGDVPVFLSEWSPAEYLHGEYNEQNKMMNLTFRSHLAEDYKVKIYSLFEPIDLLVNGNKADGLWKYDPTTGWLEINLTGDDAKNLSIRFGNKVAPLHPYFTKLDD
jgi:hypothetical protein